MGACGSTPPHTTVDKQISKQIKKEYHAKRSAIRILLLGAGECGKSTILKQMKILHRNGFTSEEYQEFKSTILDNTLTSIQTLISACDHFGIPIEDETAKNAADVIRRTKTPTSSNEFIEATQTLWSNSSIQTAFARSNEFSLLDSAPYFLSHVHRTFAPDYQPTHEDVLRARKATCGIIETDFTMEKTQFKLFDVGGQRGERKKWIHCFEDVKAILFIASLNEYDQVLAEDPSRNRLVESLTLFEGILTLPWFKHTSVILFLNKNDLFQRKILKTDLGIYFAEYADGCHYEHALHFIKEMFFTRNQNPNKTIYAHVTDATDTKQIEFVWKCVKHIVMQSNLAKAGLMT